MGASSGANQSAETELLLPAYREIKHTLDSGDLILFGGEGPVCMRIKSWTGSRWSHVAMVYRTHGVKQPLLLESTALTLIPDSITGAMKAGVTLVDLDTWLKTYAEGEIAVRRLILERTPKMRKSLRVFFEKMHGRPYETSALQMFRAMYDGPFGASPGEDLSSLFCSELIAACYQRMGLLPYDPPSNEYIPRDFSTERPTPLTLLGGATLAPELLLRGKKFAAG